MLFHRKGGTGKCFDPYELFSGISINGIEGIVYIQKPMRLQEEGSVIYIDQIEKIVQLALAREIKSKQQKP